MKSDGESRGLGLICEIAGPLGCGLRGEGDRMRKAYYRFMANNRFLSPFLCCNKVAVTGWVIYKEHRLISYRSRVWKAGDQ